MIEVQGLTKRYGGHVAVDDVRFSAKRGEILGFLGPNGAGKTTTMRMLTCFVAPTAGTATIAGYDILEASEEVRRRIGYLPEQVPLYRDMTVTEYLRFIGTLKGMSRADLRDRPHEVMRQCGIEDVRNRPIGKLSRGYRQRVGLAQALINDPEVLILDEPTVGLDPKQIVEIRELIRGLAGSRTVILSTHILPEVSIICQRVVIIHKGRLISDDTPEHLGGSLSQSAVIDIEIRGDADAARATLLAVEGVISASPVRVEEDTVRYRVESGGELRTRESIAAALIHAGFGVLEMTPRNPTLEDVFVHLVTDEGGQDA